MPEHNIVTPSRTRLDALTGVRILAAGWVVLYHYQDRIDQGLPGAGHLDRFLNVGYLGVDLFFVLSGFILAYTYLGVFRAGVTPAKYGRFLQLRLARMYPVHLFTLHVVVGLLLATKIAGIALSNPEGHSYAFGAYVLNLGLVQNWFTRELSFNGVAWSLSAEWAAYLVFPLAAVALARYRSRVVSIVGIVVSYALLIVSFSTWLSHGESAANGMLVRVGCEFAAGCFLYRLYADTPNSRALGWASIPALAAIVALPYVHHIDSYHQGIVWAPLFGVLVLALAYGVGPLARGLSGRRALYWGEVSFALYMTHGLVEYGVNKAFPGSLAAHGRPIAIAALLAIGAAVLAAAAVTHDVIERPSRLWLRNLPLTGRSRRRQPVSAEPVAATSIE